MPSELPDLWATVDFPVLQAAAAWQVTDDPLRPPLLSAFDLTGQVADGTLSVTSVRAALGRLRDGGFLTVMEALDGLSGPSHVERLTAEGLRSVGMWPNPERFVESLAMAFDEVAVKMEPREPERAARLKEVAVWLGGGARGLGVDLLARLIAHASGLP